MQESDAMDEDQREEERIRLKYEVGRLASDLHSEKRGRERMLDRMQIIERQLARLEDERDRIKWTWDRVITIGAAVAMIVIEIIRK